MDVPAYYDESRDRSLALTATKRREVNSLVTGLPTLTRFGSRDKMAVVLERMYSACFSVNLPSLKKCCFINSTLGTI